eukprot:m.336268 g.336268  ORF g.336268 m.336268 type:complete len:678 (-) comp17802_c0_seq1:111-2144(-)
MAAKLFFMLLLLLVLGDQAAAAEQFLIWPPPQQMAAEGAQRDISNNVRIGLDEKSTMLLTDEASARMEHAKTRYLTYMRLQKQGISSTSNSNAAPINVVSIAVESGDHFLGIATRYNYSLHISSSSQTVMIKAASIYGAMYALESLTQLIDSNTGKLYHEDVTITDAPDYNWRGLMIDSGRRFFPVPVVKNLLDTMAGVKLNVLHLHASDMCRFGVESKTYPNLTAALTGIHGGFYTQEDVADLISYGSNLGIRIVPEFDFPGHSRGYIPAESDGVEFCLPTSDERSQLFGDPDGKTYKVVHDLLKEMSSLFTDEVFNIGCDETAVKGRCTLESTYAIERKMFTAIANEFGKTPEGWEEAYFDAGAATNNTIVNAWARHTAAEITATGRRAVESKAGAFYFTEAAPGGPSGWSKCWYDISTNVPADQMKLLLGGEMSMWSDTYCYIDQCGSAGGGPPVGAPLFPPTRDVEFGKSIGGMIWPRGYVGAAAFYNFNTTAQPDSPAFVSAIYKLNDMLQARGSSVCPTNCSCDQLSACGKPYITPQPGTSVSLSACKPTEHNTGDMQRWNMTMDGKIQLISQPNLCVLFPGANVYPLLLGNCTDSRAAVWQHDSESSEIKTSADICWDVAVVNMSVGAYKCGPQEDQPNQHWSFDKDTGMIISLDIGKDAAGECITATSV